MPDGWWLMANGQSSLRSVCHQRRHINMGGRRAHVMCLHEKMRIKCWIENLSIDIDNILYEGFDALVTSDFFSCDLSEELICIVLLCIQYVLITRYSTVYSTGVHNVVTGALKNSIPGRVHACWVIRSSDRAPFVYWQSCRYHVRNRFLDCVSSLQVMWITQGPRQYLRIIFKLFISLM